MNHKKNLATVLALLMAVQNSGQPWSVMAYEEETNTETVQGDSDAVNEVTEEPVIVEEEETPVEDTETAEPVVDENPAEEGEAPAESAAPTFADMSENGQVPVAAHTETGDILERKTMPLGEINGDAVKEDGYDFVDAKVGETKVKAVRRLDETGDFYYITEASDTPVLLEQGQTIVLTYKEQAKAEQPAKAPVKEETAAADEGEQEAEEVSVFFYLYTQGSNVPAFQEVKTKTGTQTVNVPQKAGYTAYLADDEGNKTGEEALTTITRDFTEDTDINIYYEAGTADYTVKHVYGDEIVTETKSGNVGALTEAAAQTKAGWSPLYISNTFINADGTTVVTVEYTKDVYQLKFDSDGGSFIVPVEMNIDSTIDLGEYKPEREGYTFAGWQLNGNSVTEIKGSDVADGKSITVTASWTPATVNYTVRYWRQNVTGDGYEYAGSETKEAKTGDTVNGANNKDTTSTSSSYYGFKFKEAPEVKVAADGSTVANVYYDRVQCTVKYRIATQYDWFGNPTKWEELTEKESTGLFGASYDG